MAITRNSAGLLIASSAGDVSDLLTKSGNLAGLTNTATARSNLGLGTAAEADTGYGTGDVPVVSGGTPTGSLFLRDDGVWAAASGGGVTSVDGNTGAVTLTSTYQGIDSDLTAIGGLSPSDDDIIQRKAGAWTNRTVAQYKADLALNNVTNDAQVPKSLYDANTILAATTDDTPVALTVAASRFVGRKSTGNIAALTPTETVTELTEDIQDLVGAMVSGNSETGIDVTYDDTNGKVDFAVNDLTAEQPHRLRPTATASTFLQSFDGRNASSQFTQTSGRLNGFAVYLRAGQSVAGIRFARSSALGGTINNQWFCLMDSSYNVLRFTSDDTNAAWGNSAVKRLALTSAYPITSSGIYYIGVMCNATTIGTMVCVTSVTGIAGGTPVLSFLSTQTGITTTASLTQPVVPVTSVTASCWFALD